MEPVGISIIIINYNTSELTYDCIRSILKHEYNKSLEFIVIDNASRKEDYINLEKLTSVFSNVKVVRSKMNLGFAAGNMLGYQFTSGKYVAFINSDVLFTEPVFDTLTDFMVNHPEVGVCGPQILNAQHEETISFRPFEGMRYKILGKKFLAFTTPSKANMKKKYTSPTEVDFVIGSFMFFDTHAFDSIGGFDTNTFLYYEESDVCYRLKKKGYKTFFLPQISYIHLEGKSSSVNQALKLEHLISYLYITRKNSGFVKYTIIKYFLILSYFFKAPFKKKNRFLFKNLLIMNESLALSMRHKQNIS
jgi:GT2 family glycosyltransferase